MKGAAQEVSRLSASYDPRDRNPFAVANLLLGRTAAARQICDGVTDAQVRIECLLRVEYVNGAREAARKEVTELRKGPGPSAANILTDAIIAASLGDGATAEQWSDKYRSALNDEEYATVHGQALIARGRTEEGMGRLLSSYRSKGMGLATVGYLWNRYSLANALARQGRITEGIAQLQDTSADSLAEIFMWPWLQCRAKLAELLRKADRVDEAVKVEDDLRHRLSEADADHPILAHLNKVASSRQ